MHPPVGSRLERAAQGTAFHCLQLQVSHRTILLEVVLIQNDLTAPKHGLTGPKLNLWIHFSNGSLPWFSSLASSHCNCPSVLADCQSWFSLLMLFPSACQFQWDWKNDLESQEFVLRNVQKTTFVGLWRAGFQQENQNYLFLLAWWHISHCACMLTGLLPLRLLAKLVMRGHERIWRQYGWEFRRYQEELEGFGALQGCGGPEVLGSAKWMHCQTWDLGRSLVYLSRCRSFCTWEESWDYCGRIVYKVLCTQFCRKSVFI